jgi:putative Mn2+ efflux pump MntP
MWSLIFIMGMWMVVLGFISHANPSDGKDLRTAKRFARSTLTATLLLAIGMSLIALYLTKGVIK